MDYANATLLSNLTRIGKEGEGMYVPYEERVETYLVPVVFILIFVLGTVGNGTLVFVFIRHRGIRTVPNIYIFSLALGDLLVILTSVPFTSTLYTVDSWPYGTAVCKVSEVAKDVSIGVSVFTLTALSGDRYVAIVSPLRRHSSSTARRHTCIMAAAIWIAAIAFAVPDAVIAEVQDLELDDGHIIQVCTCFPTSMGRTYPKVMVVARFLVLYLLPLVVISAFYVCIAFHLFLSVTNLNATAMAGQNTAAQIRARKKVAKTVLSFVVIFVICFAPYHGVTLWFFLYPNAREEYNGWWHALRIVGFVLSFLNSCVNPVALYFVSGQFRKYFNRYLFNVRGPRGLGSRRGSSRTRVHFHSINTATQPPASDHGALDDSLVHGLVHDLVHDLDGPRGHALLKDNGDRLLQSEALTAVTHATEQ
ncbi:neuropeptide CCHamide-1 receptor isoform X2 [Thrips palmi]|uniref:Neuropeptide CCHamide-1 receptor isoform X2 n=1 Tax=Thrips palmi TaxID=161013 RepID=A0A6P8YVT6_THRPL|nr:neuropeptide CCHamide-1 receptor isoform X2 [Thrips palmi]